MDKPLKSVAESSILNGEASHNLFLVQRVGVETFLELTVEPITDSVRRWLTILFMEEEQKKQSRAYQPLEIMGLRHMTGILFGQRRG